MYPQRLASIPRFLKAERRIAKNTRLEVFSSAMALQIWNPRASIYRLRHMLFNIVVGSSAVKERFLSITAYHLDRIGHSKVLVYGMGGGMHEVPKQ